MFEVMEVGRKSDDSEIVVWDVPTQSLYIQCYLYVYLQGVCCVYDLIVACEIDPASLLTKVSSKVSSPEKRNGVDSKVKIENSVSFIKAFL